MQAKRTQGTMSSTSNDSVEIKICFILEEKVPK